MSVAAAPAAASIQSGPKLGPVELARPQNPLSGPVPFAIDTVVPHAVTTMALSPPQWSAVNTTATSTTLQWGKVSGATGYLVYEMTAKGWSLIGSYGSSVTAVTVTGLSPNTGYTFDVVACNSGGTTWGTAAVVTTHPLAPSPPQWSAVNTTATGTTLQWGKVSGATGYLVYEMTAKGWSLIGSYGSSVTAVTVTGLSPYTSYTFDVVASNSGGTTWGTAAVVTTHPLVDNPALDATAVYAYGSHYIAAPNPTLLWGAGGPKFTDVQQGGEGDCWLLSAYAAIVAHNPALIENMFHYLGTWSLSDGAVAFYNVTFYADNGVAHTVVVDTELPTGPYSGGYEYDQPVNGVLWAALLEKGYAEANGHGWVDTQYGKLDSYAALNGGYPSWALTAVTDHSASITMVNSGTIAADLLSGNAIICIWTANPSDPEIVAGHSYGIVGYNSKSSLPFEVYNPWGANANYSNVYETFYANGSFINQQFAYMSICII